MAPAVIFASETTFTSDQLLECRLIPEISARVECYDGIVDSLRNDVLEENRQTVSTDNAHADSSQRVPTNQPDSTEQVKTGQKIEAEDLFGKDRAARQELVQKELDIKSIDQIKSLVVKAERSAQKLYIVYLENGQVWKQKKGYGSWRIKQGDVVVITTASMGSFRMRIDGKNKSVGAKRLK